MTYLKWFKDKAATTVAFLLVTILAIAIPSCQPKCESLLDPQRKVSRNELKAELDMLTAKARARIETLDQQELLFHEVFNHVLAAASQGTYSPLALFTLLGTFMGIGTTADNVRLRRKAKQSSALRTDANKTDQQTTNAPQLPTDPTA